MITATKILITLVGLLIAAAIVSNGWTYLGYGGLKGGWFSNALVLLGHAGALVTVAAGVVYTWRYKV